MQSGPVRTTPIAVYDLPITRVVTDFEEFPGQTDSIYSVQVRARVSGYMTNVYFKDGSMVQKEDKLFEIDPRMYKADLDRAKGTVEQYEAHLARLDKEYHRAKNLLAKRSISQEEYDRYESDYKEAVANVEVARANRDLAALNLEWTEVRAPISGLLSRRMVDPGNLIKSDDTQLTSIVSLDPLYVYFDVHEQAMLRLKRLLQQGKLSQVKAQGDKAVPVLIGLSDEDSFPHKGIVDFTDNRVDLNTGTLRFRAKIDNPADQNGNRFIVPGLFVRVRLPIGDPHSALMIREQALVTDQGRKTVFVIREKKDKDGKPELNEKGEPKYVTLVRDVGTPGVLRDGYREVEKGLEPGDWVVVSGMQRLRPGAEVKPEKYDEKAPASAAGKAAVKKVSDAMPAGHPDAKEPAHAAPAGSEAAPPKPVTPAPASPGAGQGTGPGAVDSGASPRPASSTSPAPIVPIQPGSGRPGQGNRSNRGR